ncbi:MAG: AAA family ATPase [Candidatus Vogelbacteria bacterium]|nr:AAA family ATPase [Candidatus Vogelbacteria bacterium]
MKLVRNRYKGVVFFGEPGSGKSTAANLLSKKIENSKLLEASLVLKYALCLNRLPKTKEQFITDADDSYKNDFIDREKARKIFLELTRKYSKTIVAESMNAIVDRKYSDRFVIIAGARALDAAKYYKLHNFLVVYLECKNCDLVERLKGRNKSDRGAREEIKHEDDIYQTKKIKKVADLVLDSSELVSESIAREILKYLQEKQVVECKRCINSNLNPAVSFDKKGHCNICQFYLENFDVKALGKEFEEFLKMKNRNEKYDVMVGISGGKDSTAILYTALELGFRPLAFTFDSGYYPGHTFGRAKEVAKKFSVDYQMINIQPYIRDLDRKCYGEMAEMYDEPESLELRQRFLNLYQEGRKHYSIKCKHMMPFVRTCQLCRRTVIRAYYAEALRNKVRVVILGVNEWAGLSGAELGSGKISAIRKLKPYKNKPAVYVVHLPFLLQRTIEDTKKILKNIGWEEPKGEDLVESNSNSCLIALAAETKAKNMLGFHPDTTRLAREVTVGFLTKDEAKRALKKIHTSKHSVRDVLKKARLI